VDPGPGGALFQSCVDRYVPKWQNQQFVAQFPELFPFAETGEPAGDHIATLLDLSADPSRVPHTATGRPSIRNLGGVASDAGDARYNFEAYIRERGDANIQTLQDLVDKANFWEDPRLPNRKAGLAGNAAAQTLATASALQTRFTMQTVVFACFAEQDLDAVVYPSGSTTPGILTSPEEPTVNDRGSSWSVISSRGFPALTVPAGFTTQVYDRDAAEELLPPVPAKLPVGIEFLGLPFGEPTLFAIASAYERATHHRVPPPGFGPVG
jgi:Asp-tRNA(Asn)/Glu-tRNA(Gln) amidotransferase A subunit family amidase